MVSAGTVCLPRGRAQKRPPLHGAAPLHFGEGCQSSPPDPGEDDEPDAAPEPRAEIMDCCWAVVSEESDFMALTLLRALCNSERLAPLTRDDVRAPWQPAQ